MKPNEVHTSHRPGKTADSQKDATQQIKDNNEALIKLDFNNTVKLEIFTFRKFS